MIVLHKLGWLTRHQLFKTLLIPRFHKKSAFITKHFWLNDFDIGNVCIYHFHYSSLL
ncbi:hypothetical protein VCSRO39_3627 [Vibrio cholerae]|nr:hypothetical protein VCSRO39_3627 [Vibrio cholerae]